MGKHPLTVNRVWPVQRGSPPAFVFETGGCWESLSATLRFPLQCGVAPSLGVPFLSSDHVFGLHILPSTKALADALYVKGTIVEPTTPPLSWELLVANWQWSGSCCTELAIINCKNISSRCPLVAPGKTFASQDWAEGLKCKLDLTRMGTGLGHRLRRWLSR